MTPNLDMLPRWLTLRKATVYCGIGRARLIQLAKDGEIKGFQDKQLDTKPWIFDRYSLDEYREGQAVENQELKIKAMEILRTL